MECLTGETLKHLIQGGRIELDMILNLGDRNGATRWMPRTAKELSIATSSRPIFL